MSQFSQVGNLGRALVPLAHTTEQIQDGAHSIERGRVVLNELRAQTAPLHERLDNLIGLSVGMTANLNFKELPPLNAILAREGYLSVYRRYLIIAFAIEYSFEKAIDSSPGGGMMARQLNISLPTSKASELILSDFSKIGGVPENLMAMIGDGIFEGAQSAAQAAGLEYVRTGSRLGGKVLAVAVKRNLGLNSDSGLSFLGLGGNDVKKQFDQFCAGLAPLAGNSEKVAEASTAAAQAFLAVESFVYRLIVADRPPTATTQQNGVRDTEPVNARGDGPESSSNPASSGIIARILRRIPGI